MGKKSSDTPVTIGYRYYMGAHMGFCHGPVDALLEITGDDKVAWSGEQTTSGSIDIRASDLYGGERKEGGVVGTLWVMMGEADQQPNAYLSYQQDGLQSGYRGLFTGVFSGLLGARTPYIKPLGVLVRRALKGWHNDDCWEPTLALIDKGMNPAHIIFESMTDPFMGAGFARDQMDLDNFRAAAVTLKAEDLGLCLGWRASVPVDRFIATVCDHVGAMLTEDPETLKQQIVLVRDDYDVDTLTLIDESAITELTRYQQTLLADTINEVQVTYHDLDTGKDASVPPAQNLANIQAQGRVVMQATEYPGFYKGSQAMRAAARDCHAHSGLPASVEMTVKSRYWQIKRGDVIAFSWSRLGIVKMPLRVLEVDRGARINSPITLKCVQDAFGLPSTTYTAMQPSGWVPPDTTPHPVAEQRVFEVPYRSLVRRMSAADLATVTEDAGYVAAMGTRPAGVAINYRVLTRTGSAAYAQTGSGDFVPGGLLAAAIPLSASAALVTLGGADDLDLISRGSAALIDDEILRIDAIDPVAGTLTLARGCADTVPAAHALGARLWCFEAHAGGSMTEYVGGDTVDVKLLTVTSAGALDAADATAMSLALDDRQIRPYPPGNLKINGVAYPATVASGLVLTWSHRDRGLQADQLVDTAAANIGPEVGVTYTVRAYLGGVLKSTSTGITGTTHTPAYPGSGTVRIEVDAVRAGYISWQCLTATFVFGTPKITNPFVAFVAGTASDFQLTAQFGTAPFVFSADSALPASMTMTADGLISYDGSGVEATADVTFGVGDVNGASSSVVLSVATIAAHVWWRLKIDAVKSGQIAAIKELEFRAQDGGATLCVGGTPFADSEYNYEHVAGNAFDGITSSEPPWPWASSDTSLPHFIGYQFASAVGVVQWAVTNRTLVASQVQIITAGEIQSSADSTNGSDGTWLTVWDLPAQADWLAGETRVFSRF